MAAYYPANYSMLSLQPDKINTSIIPKGIVYFEYDELEKSIVNNQSLVDALQHLLSIINNLDGYELCIYSHSLRKPSKNSGLHFPLDDYNYILMDTNEDIPQLKIISAVLNKELNKRMKEY